MNCREANGQALCPCSVAECPYLTEGQTGREAVFCYFSSQMASVAKGSIWETGVAVGLGEPAHRGDPGTNTIHYTFNPIAALFQM